jgi:hypothetical protein
MIYEAKVLKAENWDETTTRTGLVGQHYLVHYKGWKQTLVILMHYPHSCISDTLQSVRSQMGRMGGEYALAQAQ